MERKESALQRASHQLQLLQQENTSLRSQLMSHATRERLDAMEREKCKLTAGIQRAQETLTTQREDGVRARAPRMDIDSRCKAMEEASGRRQRQYILGASRVHAAASHSLRASESAEVLRTHWRQQQDVIAKHQERIRQLTEERRHVMEERRRWETLLCSPNPPPSSTRATTTTMGEVEAASQEDLDGPTLPPPPPPSSSQCATGHSASTASAAPLPTLPPFSLFPWTSFSRHFPPTPALLHPSPSRNGTAPAPANPPFSLSCVQTTHLPHPVFPHTNTNAHASLSSAVSFYAAQGQQWQRALLALRTLEEEKKRWVDEVGQQVELAERGAQTARECFEQTLNRCGMGKSRKRVRDSIASCSSRPEGPPPAAAAWPWTGPQDEEECPNDASNACCEAREEKAPPTWTSREERKEEEEGEEARDFAPPMTTMTPGMMEGTNPRASSRRGGGCQTSSAFQCRLCHTDILATFADACFRTTEAVCEK